MPLLMAGEETNLEIMPEHPASGSPFRFSDRTGEVQAILNHSPFHAYRMNQGNSSRKERCQRWTRRGKIKPPIHQCELYHLVSGFPNSIQSLHIKN